MVKIKQGLGSCFVIYLYFWEAGSVLSFGYLSYPYLMKHYKLKLALATLVIYGTIGFALYYFLDMNPVPMVGSAFFVYWYFLKSIQKNKNKQAGITTDGDHEKS